MPTDIIKAALLRTADFFEANPDKRTRRALARDINDFSLNDPNDPAAVCWCALGRLAVELNIKPAAEEFENCDIIYEAIEAAGVRDYYEIWSTNDTTDNIIPFLRELAK